MTVDESIIAIEELSRTGIASKYKEALKVLVSYIVEKGTWHLYPEEKPTEKDEVYLVTLKNKVSTFTFCAYWDGNGFELLDSEYWTRIPEIVAWKKMPKEFRGEK